MALTFPEGEGGAAGTGEASQERKASTFSEGTSLSVVLGAFGRGGIVVVDADADADADGDEDEDVDEDVDDVNVVDVVVFDEEEVADEVDEGIGRVVEDAAVLVLVISSFVLFCFCVALFNFVCSL